jgi:hypothetical protein
MRIVTHSGSIFEECKGLFRKIHLRFDVCFEIPRFTCKPFNLNYKMPGLNLSIAAIQASAYKKVSESTCNAKARLWKAADICRVKLYRGVILKAQAIRNRQMAKVIGLSDQARSKSPRLIAPIARVPPQPGQGYPVIKRTGQRIGPFSNPLVRIVPSRTRIQATNKKITRLALVLNTFVVNSSLITTKTHPKD